MENILEHRWTANIAAIVAAIAAVVVPIGLYALQKGDATGPQPEHVSHWTGMEIFLIVIICVLFPSQIVIYLNARLRRNKQVEREVIGKLSALQESCILTPHYVTTVMHAAQSKESVLSSGGTADILTNSLKYDIFYSATIAINIIRGAKYIYILPNKGYIIADLQNYIVKICESVQKELREQKSDDASRFDELRSQNLEFYFFDDENFCLYNFAILRQTATAHSEPFVQYWWYINPANTDPNSPMLKHEIHAHQEKIDLDGVFQLLKSGATKKNGKDVFDYRNKLNDLLRGVK